MSDLKEVTKRFFDSKTITQLIVLIIIMVLAGTYVFTEIQDNKQGTATLKEMKKTNDNIENLLTKLVEKTGEIETLTRCVDKAFIDARYIFKNDFSIILGETLEESGIKKFPQKLNQSFSRFEDSFDKVRYCLLFPEDLK